MPGNIEGIIRIQVLLEGESYRKIYGIYQKNAKINLICLFNGINSL